MNRPEETTADRQAQLSPEERQSVHEWTILPAPGEQRILRTTAPPLMLRSNTLRSRRMRMLLFQLAAGLILFAAGFLAGTARTGAAPGQQPHLAVSASPPTIASKQAPENAIHQKPKVVAQQSSQKSSTTSAHPVEKDCPAPQVYQGSDGRFRIDTTLCESGSHATWIINPKLELAKVPTTQSEETQ